MEVSKLRVLLVGIVLFAVAMGVIVWLAHLDVPSFWVQFSAFFIIAGGLFMAQALGLLNKKKD